MTPISSNWTGAHGVLGNFQILTEVANLKENESCGECFDVNFDELDSCTGCFAPALTLTKVAKFKRNDSCAVF